MESLGELVERQAGQDEYVRDEDKKKTDPRQQMKALSEMFSAAELDMIRKHGGALQKGYNHVHDAASTTQRAANGSPRRVLIGASSDDSDEDVEVANSTNGSDPYASTILEKGTSGNLSGVYKHVSIAPACCTLLLHTAHHRRHGTRLKLTIVPPGPTDLIPTHSFCLSPTSFSRYTSISIAEPHRGLEPNADGS